MRRIWLRLIGSPSLCSSVCRRSSVQWHVGGVVPASGAGGRARALATTRLRSASLYVGGRPARRASSRASLPPASKRRTHCRTIFSDTPAWRATAGTVAPSAAALTMRARCTSRTGAVCARTSRSSFTRSSSVSSRTRMAVVTFAPPPAATIPSYHSCGTTHLALERLSLSLIGKLACAGFQYCRYTPDQWH